MSKLTTQIELMGATLAPGMASEHFICPSCLGGRTKEKSFIIIRNKQGKLWYKCHRATCGFNGCLNNSQSGYDSSQIRTDKVYTDWKDYPHFVSLFNSEDTGMMAQLLSFDYGITTKEIINNGFLYNLIDNTLIMPIRTLSGADIGFVDRSFDGRKPKSLTTLFGDHVILDTPWWSCSWEGRQNPIVVVEDKLSAIKVARFIPCVALLGSHMTLNQACLLSQYTSSIIIMLDGDALHKALKMKKEYQLLFDDIKIISLQGLPDPKDMTIHQLLSVIGGN